MLTCQTNGLGDQLLGEAARPTKRADILVNRVTAHSALIHNDVGDPFDVVVHEVGHLLLPANRHSPSGIMRANREGRLAGVPGFTNGQATTNLDTIAG